MVVLAPHFQVAVKITPPQWWVQEVTSRSIWRRLKEAERDNRREIGISNHEEVFNYKGQLRNCEDISLIGIVHSGKWS